VVFILNQFISCFNQKKKRGFSKTFFTIDNNRNEEFSMLYFWLLMKLLSWFLSVKAIALHFGS
jgi:hypothetical protein